MSENLLHTAFHSEKDKIIIPGMNVPGILTENIHKSAFAIYFLGIDR
jgi:hypothetical protein